jgi:hypothetical protein
VPECAGQADFDIPATAGLYSTLAGVLAGFAFTALMSLLALRVAATAEDDRRLGSVVEVLLAAFIALVLSSLTYAALGGEPESGGRSASEEILAGVGLVVAALLLLYSVPLTIEASRPFASSGDTGTYAAARFIRRVLVHAVGPLVVFYLALGVEDYLTVRDGVDRDASTLDIVSVSLAVAALIVSFPIFSVARRGSIRTAGRWAAVGGLSVAFLSAVSFAATTAFLKRCEIAPEWSMYLAITVNFLAVLGAMVLIAIRHDAGASAGESGNMPAV